MPKIHRSFHARNRSPIRAAIRPAICSQFRAESARLPGPLSRTIGATMQPAPSTPSTQPHVLALRLRGEKPHQGLRSKNPAPYRVRNRCNLRNALGLRAGCAGNRVRSFCSGEQYDSDLGLYYLRARYYNPATGRFLSRDPEDPDMGRPNDPKTLHKYLYAGGDPVNGLDPSGRGMLEFGSLDALIAEPAVPALTALTIHGAAWAATAVEVAAEITADLAIEAAEAAAGEFAAAADELVTTVNELNALMRESSVIGALTRALACADGMLIASEIVDHAFHSKNVDVVFDFVGGVACYTVLDIRVVHH